MTFLSIQVREGVSKAARSVTSSISSLTSWLNTEWRDGHVDDDDEGDTAKEEGDPSSRRDGDGGDDADPRPSPTTSAVSAGVNSGKAEALGTEIGGAEEATGSRSPAAAAQQAGSEGVEDCEDSSFEAVLVDAVRVGRREPVLSVREARKGEPASGVVRRPTDSSSSWEDEETEEGLVLVGSAHSRETTRRPVCPLPARPAAAAAAAAAAGEANKKANSTRSSGWLAGLWSSSSAE